MKIDNINISRYGARQKSCSIQPSEIINESEKINGSVSPVFFRSEVGIKTLKIELLFQAKRSEEIEKNISDCTALLLEPRVIKIDYQNFLYTVILTKVDSTNEIKSGAASIVTYTFVGYACGTRKKLDFNQALKAEWKIKGNIPTSAVVTITPTLSIQAATLTGFSDDPITIRNLKKDQAVILDGEVGTVTEAGQNKFKDVDLWAFPRLLPGMQKVTCDVESLKIHVEYNPRYL